MGGASDRPLETAGGRNGFVSGETPWNRSVRWGGAERCVRQRTWREVPTQPARARRESVGFARSTPTMPRPLQPGLAALASASVAGVVVAGRCRPSGRVDRSASDAVGSPTGGPLEANRNGHLGGHRLRRMTWGSALERIGASSIGAHGSSPHFASVKAVFARRFGVPRGRRPPSGVRRRVPTPVVAQSAPRCHLFGGDRRRNRPRSGATHRPAVRFGGEHGRQTRPCAGSRRRARGST